MFRKVLAHPPVSYFWRQVNGHEDIVGFDIPVDDPGPMCITEGISDLADYFQCLCNRYGFVDGIERCLDEFHLYIRDRQDIDFGYFDNIGVVKGLPHPDLV